MRSPSLSTWSETGSGSCQPPKAWNWKLVHFRPFCISHGSKQSQNMPSVKAREHRPLISQCDSVKERDAVFNPSLSPPSNYHHCLHLLKVGLIKPPSGAKSTDCVNLVYLGILFFNEMTLDVYRPSMSPLVPPLPTACQRHTSGLLPGSWGPYLRGPGLAGTGDKFSLMGSCTGTQTHPNNQGFYITQLSQSYFQKETVTQQTLRPSLKARKMSLHGVREES